MRIEDTSISDVGKILDFFKEINSKTENFYNDVVISRKDKRSMLPLSDNAEKFIIFFLNDFAKHPGTWLIAKDGQQVVGSCLCNISTTRDRLMSNYELDFFVSEKYLNQGVEGELLKETIRSIKKIPVVKRMVACYLNKNSGDVFSKRGFEFEGALKRQVKLDDNYFDQNIMSLVL